MPTADVTRAMREALELLQSYGVQQPPIDVKAIAEGEGAMVVFEQMEDQVSGLLVQKQGTVTIGVNALHQAGRQRFTLAHELGHFKLHPKDPTVYVDDVLVHFRGEGLHAPATPAEIEANSFAANLLMPEDFLRRDLAGRVIDVSDDVTMRRLATRYGVSQQALTIRLMELDLLDGLPAASSPGR